MELDSIYNGEDFIMNISRAKFNEICSSEFKKLINLFLRVLKDG